jgi:hypothetical protein
MAALNEALLQQMQEQIASCKLNLQPLLLLLPLPLPPSLLPQLLQLLPAMFCLLMTALQLAESLGSLCWHLSSHDRGCTYVTRSCT